MARLFPLKGSYWEDYPVPACPQRCFARRTLHEAFGGSPGLTSLAEPPRWRLALCSLGLVLGVAAMTVVTVALLR